jgi:AraC family transcriptional regulator
VNYLTAHLDDALDLYRLADEASFSPYHFHRVYAALMGETVTDTLKRMRLHRAAVKLLASSDSLARLAREAHYGSVPAFNRAFKEAYGTPPAAYRARGAAATLQRSHATFEEALMYEVSIETRQPQRVAALRHSGHYHEIGKTFERLAAWAAGRDLLIPAARSFGIYYDDPNTVPAAQLRSDACITIAQNVTPDGECRLTHTPGGRCAVLVHVGPYAELERPYKWLYGVWLPESGYEPDNKPCFEEYLNDCRVLPPAEWRTAICVPLKD